MFGTLDFLSFQYPTKRLIIVSIVPGYPCLVRSLEMNPTNHFYVQGLSPRDPMSGTLDFLSFQFTESVPVGQSFVTPVLNSVRRCSTVVDSLMFTSPTVVPLSSRVPSHVGTTGYNFSLFVWKEAEFRKPSSVWCKDHRRG